MLPVTQHLGQRASSRCVQITRPASRADLFWKVAGHSLLAASEVLVWRVAGLLAGVGRSDDEACREMPDSPQPGLSIV